MKILLLICALWSSMYTAKGNGGDVHDPSDGDAHDFNVNIGNLANGEFYNYKLTCNGVCKPRQIFAGHNGGRLSISGYKDDIDYHPGFCWDMVYGNPQLCQFDYDNSSFPTTNTIYVAILAKESACDVELHVIGNVESAEVYYRSDNDWKGTFHHFVGPMNESYDMTWKITCKGRCFLHKMFAEYKSGRVDISGVREMCTLEYCPWEFCFNRDKSYPQTCQFDVVHDNETITKGSYFFLGLQAQSNSESVRFTIDGNIEKAELWTQGYSWQN